MIEDIRSQFPILSKQIYNQKPLIYLDNAATTQKPNCVIDSMTSFYQSEYGSPHSQHFLATQTTIMVEQTRELVAKFIKADYPTEIIFTKGATEGLNFIANQFILNPIFRLTSEDTILVSQMEHHANFVPWQMVAKLTGANLKIIPINLDGDILTVEMEQLLANNKVKVVAITQASNVLGKINPVKELVKLSHKYSALAVIDGCQAVAHIPVNMQDLDCDFYVFSGHKMYGPTGVGVMYTKLELLQQMIPLEYGGDMVKYVTNTSVDFNVLPHKMEAGTQNLASIKGLQATLIWLDNLPKELSEHKKNITKYTKNQLLAIPNLQILGANQDIPIFSFFISSLNSLDIGLMLDLEGIAVRTGQNCAHPLYQFFGVQNTCRVSLGLYNTTYEVDYFVEKLKSVILMLT